MQGLVIYKSSAGSGKTYTLVLEYLKIVILKPTTYRHVLAITFTNKATNEMKARIIETLMDLAAGKKDSVYWTLYKLLKEKQLNNKLSIEQRARIVLNFILRDYTNFSVSTIESFFQRIIRSFAKELNLPLKYEVELQQHLVLEKITDDMFMDVGVNKPLTRLLKKFVERQMEEQKNWRVEKDILHLGNELFKERYQAVAALQAEDDAEVAAEKALKLADELWAIRTKFTHRMQTLAQNALAIMEQHALSIKDFSYGKSGVAGYIQRVSKADNPKAFIPTSRARQAYDNDDKWCSKRSKRKSHIESALADGLKSLLGDIIDTYDSDFPNYLSAIEASRMIFSFGLMNDLQQKLSNYRKDSNHLIISDTNKLLDNIVSEDDTPFVYEKVGNRFHYYLIDEFQDTSDLQWRNIMPLVLESIARGKGSLIVGDVKQSIYRWRNGNMQLLMSEVEEAIQRNHQQVKVFPLTHNWRTAASIVEFNNAFFEECADVLASLSDDSLFRVFPTAYKGVAQKPQKKNIDGYVELAFIEGKSPRDSSETPHWKELSLERTLSTINQLKKEGFQGNEITLLVRTNKHGIQVAEYLQRHDIKVVSSESLLIANYPSVLFVQSLLTHLNNESDQLALATASYYYEVVIKHTPVSDGLFRREGGMRLPEFFMEARIALRQLPVYECVERILQLFPDLLVPNAYLQGFMDSVLEYSSTNDTTISGFLEWWNRIKGGRSITSAPEAEAVQIITIHKSKGLEFPVVIMPFVDWSIVPSFLDVLWAPTPTTTYQPFEHLPIRPVKALAETHFYDSYIEEQVLTYLDNLNVLYVALTRPKYRLYMFMKDSKPTAKLNNVYNLVKQVMASRAPEGRWLEGELTFTAGKAISREELRKQEGKPKKESHKTVLLKSNPSTLSDWDTALHIRYSSNRYLKSGLLEQENKVSRGELIHEALSHIQVAADLPNAIRQMLLKGYIIEEQRAYLETQLKAVIQQPEVVHWYGGTYEVRNEVEIISETGALLRPDRVMLQGNTAIVVDYKTGKTSYGHNRQIKMYTTALEKMGYSQVEGYIYYISDGLIKQIQ